MLCSLQNRGNESSKKYRSLKASTGRKTISHSAGTACRYSYLSSISSESQMGGGGAINKPWTTLQGCPEGKQECDRGEVGITEPAFQELPLKLNISYFQSLKKTVNSCFPIEKRLIIS